MPIKIGIPTFFWPRIENIHLFNHLPQRMFFKRQGPAKGRKICIRSESENKLGGVAPIPIKGWPPSEMEFVPMIKGPITRRLYLFYKGSYRDDDDSMITGYSSDLALRAGID